MVTSYKRSKAVFFLILGAAVVVAGMVVPTVAPGRVRPEEVWIRHTLTEGGVEHRIIHHPNSIECPACRAERGSR